MTNLLSNYFKVNDNVVYKPNWKFSQKEKGTVLEANVKSPSNIGRKIGCIVKMDSGRTQWYSEDTLTLDRQLKTEENQEAVNIAANSEFTVKCAKELKSELENVIHNLIQDFNKKTNLQIKDIDLDRERTLGGDCLYRVTIKVEI